MRIDLPDPSLVVLVGASGAGKSTFARRHFLPTETISSDACRGLVADDENDQAATNDAFAVLRYIADRRLAQPRLTVVDATNVQREARKPLLELARRHDLFAVAIVLDLPARVCHERNASRPDRDFGPHVVGRQRAQLERSVKRLRKEGFLRVFTMTSPEEVDACEIVRTPLWTDRRAETGPFDVIGDVHGCFDELVALLRELGYAVDAAARTAVPPPGRRAVFVGDLVDRGPASPAVLALAMAMTEAGHALCVPGNHDDKLARKLAGRDVRIAHGLAETLEQLDGEDDAFRERVREFLAGLVSHVVLDGGDLVVAHAGMKAEYQGRSSGRVRDFALYGETTGHPDDRGLPVRLDWAADYRGAATVVYGHTPVAEPAWTNRTINIDTGCVFGGRLTALRWPERELVSVPAARSWAEPMRPFLPSADPGEAARAPSPSTGGTMPAAAATTHGGDDTNALRADGGGRSVDPTGAADREDPARRGFAAAAVPRTAFALDMADVAGRRIVATRLARNVTVREEQAAAALEVMGRFAIDPRWLVHLPPTMAPPATSRRPDLLEHPDQAFDEYAAAGVGQVVCEEKHMGSRAIVVVCRDAAVARQRFGVADGSTGTIHTRTGRAFLEDAAATEEALARVRAAADAAGLWDELGTGWLLLDAEILPWSAKAGDLIRRQYAAVGAAGRAGLGATIRVLEDVAERGVDVADVLAAERARLDHVERYVAAYSRYVGEVSSVPDLRLAPFHLLAAESGVFVDRPHDWHLERCDRLVAGDPAWIVPTGRRIVDVADEASRAAAVAWWEELTAGGGEGMVVKPRGFLAPTRKGWAQAGIKVRGREYLRIVYGPEYADPAQIDRLRARGLGRKRSLAARELALGVEALERFVAREPLHRVHECVFAVLALESDPVDPRL